MNRTLVILGISAGAVLSLAACRNDPVNPTVYDLSHPTGDMAAPPGSDLAGGPDDFSVPPGSDLSVPIASGATLHDINTGAIGDKTAVTVKGLVLTGVANGNGHSKTGKLKCRYYAFLQDPAGMTFAGIRLYASGDPCTPADGGKCTCPYPPKSNTPLDALADGNAKLGDTFDVTGTVSVYAANSSDAGLAPPTHEIDVTALTKTGSGGVIMPYVPAKPTDFANTGAGYQTYESMVVTIKPAMPATAGAHDNFGGFDFAGAHFAGDYDFIWGMKGAYPAANMSLKSITGVADPSYGGGISPRTMADFQP